MADRTPEHPTGTPAYADAGRRYRLDSPIATGGMLPRGADAVVMIEFTDVTEGELILQRPVAPGANITFAGTDIGQGEVVLYRGELLTSRAGMAGARVRAWAVERTEPLSLSHAPGRVLRSHGLVARADVVAFALEPQDASAAAAEPSARAPLLPGAEAWIATGHTLPFAQLLLTPAPGVDGLLLLPVPSGMWVLAFGPSVEPVDLSLLVVEASCCFLWWVAG